MAFFETLAGQLLVVAGVVGAVSTIWIKGVWPLLKGMNALGAKIYSLGQDLPILQEIADQFKPNHGKSLHDHITALQDDVQYIKLDVAAIRMDDRLYDQRLGDVTQRVERLEAR